MRSALAERPEGNRELLQPIWREPMTLLMNTHTLMENGFQALVQAYRLGGIKDEDIAQAMLRLVPTGDIRATFAHRLTEMLVSYPDMPTRLVDYAQGIRDYALSARSLSFAQIDTAQDIYRKVADDDLLNPMERDLMVAHPLNTKLHEVEEPIEPKPVEPISGASVQIREELDNLFAKLKR
jgi:hypothetical protein